MKSPDRDKRQIRKAAGEKEGSEGGRAAAAQHKSKQQILQQIYQPNGTNTFIYTRERRQINERNSGDAREKREAVHRYLCSLLFVLFFCSSRLPGCWAFYVTLSYVRCPPSPPLPNLLSPNIKNGGIHVSVCLSHARPPNAAPRRNPVSSCRPIPHLPPKTKTATQPPSPSPKIKQNPPT